jgi:ABC-type transport system involved in multi-copper enzyme maturation permease subunit
MTLREATRKRLLWVLLALTIVTVALTTWGVERLVALGRESGIPEIQIVLGVSQVLILVAFMFSFVLAMTAAFLGAPSIAGDLESGVALALLARPLRRSELIVGKWLGLAAVVAGYAMAAGLLQILTVRLVSGHAPPDPIGAALYLAGQASVLLALTILVSTRLPAIAGGAVAVVVFGLAWMAGVMAGVGAAFEVPVLVRAAEVSRIILPTDALWRGAVFSLEPPLVVLLAAGRRGQLFQSNPFYAGAPPSALMLAWTALWVIGILALAAWSLRRREI